MFLKYNGRLVLNPLYTLTLFLQNLCTSLNSLLYRLGNPSHQFLETMGYRVRWIHSKLRILRHICPPCKKSHLSKGQPLSWVVKGGILCWKLDKKLREEELKVIWEGIVVVRDTTKAIILLKWSMSFAIPSFKVVLLSSDLFGNGKFTLQSSL